MFLLGNVIGVMAKLDLVKKPIWGISSVGRALALQARGHGFESRILHLKP